MAEGNLYLNSLFYGNDLGSGLPGSRYDLNLSGRAEVRGCVFGGPVIGAGAAAVGRENILRAPDPEFDADFVCGVVGARISFFLYAAVG